MKNYFLTALITVFLCSSMNINAQQVNTAWVLNDFTGYPAGVMIALDNSGSVVVTGHSGDFSKIITSKYTTNGVLIWQKFYSIPNFGVAATWLSVDQSGNVIVTGYPRTYSSNPVESGLLTLKYDNNGNLLWDRLISGTWAFAVRSIVDQAGNIYVTGRAWQYTATYDFVTVKYSPTGTQMWLDTFDQNGGFHTPTSMDLDQSGNLFVTGGGNSGGAITVMYNNSGVRQWVTERTGTSGHSIKADGRGGVFVTGSLYNQSTSDDVILIKYNMSGNVVWQKVFDFGNTEYGRLINFDSHKNIYITGQGAVQGSFTGWLTTKTDSLGNLIWFKRFKSNQSWEEFPYFALVGPQDEIYITGNVGVPSGGTTYNGLETIRYNSNGNTAWTAAVNLYGGIGKGLALGADMSVYAVGMYYYTVIKYGQTNIPTGVVSNGVPAEYSLSQNFPNPFNPVTKISFALPKQEFVTLKVYDILGKEAAVLVNETRSAGNYSVDFNGANLTSGVYFYKLETNGFTDVKKMSLIK